MRCYLLIRKMHYVLLLKQTCKFVCLFFLILQLLSFPVSNFYWYLIFLFWGIGMPFCIQSKYTLILNAEIVYLNKAYAIFILYFSKWVDLINARQFVLNTAIRVLLPKMSYFWKHDPMAFKFLHKDGNYLPHT